MGISKDYAVGEAFDQDLQEQKKQERIEQRERDFEKRQQERKEVCVGCRCEASSLCGSA